MDENELELEYSFANIGPVRIHLYSSAASFYRILEQQKEIERLRNLMHLGTLEMIFPGARHTRWDYTLLQLHLANCLNFPSMTSERKFCDIQTTGRELLQILILASNIGHLPGTFAVERGVLHALFAKDDGLKGLIRALKNLPFEEEDSKLIERTLQKHQDYNIVHKVLALVKLSKWLDTSDTIESQKLRCEELAAKLILLNLTPQIARESEARLLANLGLLRKMAYIHMDSTFLPMPIGLDFASFIRFLTTSYNLNSYRPINAEEIIPETFPNFIYEYEKALFSKIYHSSKARVLVRLVGEKIKQRLLKSHAPIEEIIKWLSMSDYEEIIGDRAKIKSVAERYESRISITIDPFLCEAFIEKGLLFWEEHIKSALEKSGGKPVTLYLPGFGDEPGVVSIDLVYEKSQRGRTIEDLSLLIGLFYRHLEKEENWYSFATAPIYKKIFERIMELYIGEGVKVKVTENPWYFFSEDADSRIVATDSLKKDWIRKECFPRKQQNDWDKATKDRFHAHISLWDMIKILRRSIYGRKKVSV